MALKKFDDLPLALLDGWHAQKHGKDRNRDNPYLHSTQWASREAWIEGFIARLYAEKNNEDTHELDEYKPRYMA